MSQQPQSHQKNQTRKRKYPNEAMDIQSTITQGNLANTENYIYLDLKSHEKTWMNDAKIELLSQELVKWALEQPTATQLRKFFHARGISIKHTNDWLVKWPIFKEYYLFAKSIIGSRREDGGLTKAYDSGIVRFTMPLYDDDWLKETERVAKLTKDDNKIASSQAINVIMQRFVSDEIEEKK